MTDVSVEMPRYKCHEEVWALKIKDIEFVYPTANAPNVGAKITPVEAGYAPFTVSIDYMTRHTPEIGGYYVVYKDGYESYSPAQTFEDGYTRIEK